MQKHNEAVWKDRVLLGNKYIITKHDLFSTSEGSCSPSVISTFANHLNLEFQIKRQKNNNFLWQICTRVKILAPSNICWLHFRALFFSNTVHLFYHCLGKKKTALLMSHCFGSLVKKRLASVGLEWKETWNTALRAGQRKAHLIGCQPIIRPEILYTLSWCQRVYKTLHGFRCWVFTRTSVLHVTWFAVRWPAFTFFLSNETTSPWVWYPFSKYYFTLIIKNRRN